MKSIRGKSHMKYSLLMIIFFVLMFLSFSHYYMNDTSKKHREKMIKKKCKKRNLPRETVEILVDKKILSMEKKAERDKYFGIAFAIVLL